MGKRKPSGKSRGPSAPPRRNSPASVPPTVSGRWLLTAIAASVIAALFCAWGTLCILFWQGSWQLLYHPSSTVTRTPGDVNLQFDSVGFGTNPTGEPQLRGWWIPVGGQGRYTAIYLHGATGNLGDTVNEIARVHALGLNVFAFDYRGYGQSHFLHPSEARWREDADSAIDYLTATRHAAPGSLILVGRDLGANLALETAAAHPNLAGIVLENPIESPTSTIFSDARARLVPAHLLVSDRWNTDAAASNVPIPSLWFYWTADQAPATDEDKPEAFQKAPARKMLVWLANSPNEPEQFNTAMRNWLDQLPTSH